MDGERHHGGAHRDTERRHGSAHGAPDSRAHALPGGLTVAANGLRIEPSETRIDPGVEHRWSYRIRDEEGNAVTEFEETHDQLAHLILVRRDLTRFQHLHPELAEDGIWTTTFSLPDPGAYRAFVDVLVDARATTLGVDLLVSGHADYDTLPGSTREVMVDGYDVAMSPESIAAREPTTVEFTVSRKGEAVRLKPYLGALGHLVALQDGDLAYLHAHPEETDPGEGTVRFAVRFPAAGRYRLFLQAKPSGELITASFDVSVGVP